MQLSFIMVPTVDGTTLTVEHWQEAGLHQVWEPDDHTVLLGADSKAQVMVQDDPAEWELGRGPVFLVDDVGAMAEPERGWALEPTSVATGGYAVSVVHGCPVRYLDLTACPEDKRELFS